MHLAYEPAATRLTVEDFAPAGRPRVTVPGQPGHDGLPGPGGYGLTGMRERAELLGGTLTTEATATGYRVELEVPA
jgi:glucose-6-phosphate-specific signal transduction histidine kinase